MYSKVQIIWFAVVDVVYHKQWRRINKSNHRSFSSCCNRKEVLFKVDTWIGHVDASPFTHATLSVYLSFFSPPNNFSFYPSYSFFFSCGPEFQKRQKHRLLSFRFSRRKATNLAGSLWYYPNSYINLQFELWTELPPKNIKSTVWTNYKKFFFFFSLNKPITERLQKVEET